jgi:ribonuclease Z
MRPLFHPQLVNGPCGDPGLYVECLFEKRALLFDLGDIQPLTPRRVLSISDIFVSHAHMDHFIGFDRVLRICLGREKRLRLFGPAGFVAQVEHRLAGYTWNLVQNYATDFTVVATEVGPTDETKSAEFHCREAFRRRETVTARIADGVILDEDAFRVRTAVVDHKIPCLAFSLEEKSHVNVWKNRLDEMGLRVGPWLRELKRAVLRGEPDDSLVRASWREQERVQERLVPLGLLKDGALRVVPGQKIAYVVDAVYHEENARRISQLARGSDVLFVEAAFLQEDGRHAASKYHLTAHQAGLLGRMAGVKRLVPFHCSPKYAGREQRLIEEAEAAFTSAEFPVERSGLPIP